MNDQLIELLLAVIVSIFGFIGTRLFKNIDEIEKNHIIAEYNFSIKFEDLSKRLIRLETIQDVSSGKHNE